MTNMNKPTATGVGRLIKACKYSLQGFQSTFKTEAAFRQECYLGLIALPLSFIIADNVVEWLLLVISYLLIMLTEVINSALEAVVDRFGQEHHQLSGKAKDAGSAAVSVAIIIALTTWVAIALF